MDSLTKIVKIFCLIRAFNISSMVYLQDSAHLGVLYSILGLIYMSNGTIRDDALDPFLIKMGLLGNPETMPPTHVQQRGLPRTTAASLGISEDIFETFGDIKEMIRKGKLALLVPFNRVFHLIAYCAFC